MSIQSWQSIIETIRNGEPVTAEVANRAIDQLTQRTQHLKQRQDAQSLASAIFISGAPLTDDVKTGHAVYFNTVAGKFAPAYAELVYGDGYLKMSETSVVAGIVVYKDTVNSGVILVDGMVDPSLYVGIDCTGESITTNLLVNTNERGLLYLANGATNAGKVVGKPGLLNVPICSLIDSNHLLVRPAISSPLETQALRFSLAARPATPELVLQKVLNGVVSDFSANPNSATDLAAGKSVRVYLCSSGTPDTETTLYFTGTVHKYSSTGEIQLKNVVVSKAAITALSDNGGDYAALLQILPGTGNAIAVKGAGSSTGYTINSPSGLEALSSYVSMIDGTVPASGYQIKPAYIDATLPGWLPANSTYFPNTSIPGDAKYGYNFAADPVLQQLFPETVVGAYIVYKDGVAVPQSTCSTGSNGIWWKDSFTKLPWHTTSTGTFKHILPDPAVVFSDWNLTTANKIIQPTDLVLAYTKLVSGGINVVTTLEAASDAPITITDPFGNPAVSGPLVINAGFTVTDASSTEAGSLVVKDISGFSMKRGRVVERILAGNNISISSAVGSGQGEVQVNVVGLDGKLEGVPDILAIDDVLVEKDASLNLFYSSMPPAKNSSILGKVDVPNYLSGTYKLNLVITFLALHSAGSVQPPSLALSWVNMKPPATGAKYNLTNSSSVTTGELAGGLSPYSTAVSPKDYFIKTVELDTVYAGGEIFFRLARSSIDTYVGKLGILSLRYKFVQSS